MMLECPTCGCIGTNWWIDYRDGKHMFNVCTDPFHQMSKRTQKRLLHWIRRHILIRNEKAPK